MKLSAVLAVRNEESMLEPCLQLLGFCDEIVVVIDDRTTDATEAVARHFTDRVWLERFHDFSQLKNSAIQRARGEWVLIVDADERVTPALAAEIVRVISGDPHEWAFRIETINFFFAQRMRNGGWLEHHTRLIRKDRAVYTGQIHEDFNVPAQRIRSLDEGMWHFSHRRIEDNLAKTIECGRSQSRELHAAGAPRVNPRRMIVGVLREFALRMFRHRGYRDGMAGVIEAIYQPFSLFCVQVMLWQRQRSESLDEAYERLEREAAERR